jgi:hypothetical protein
VKAAGLAMALVPLAAVAATTAEPQLCSSAGMVCGTVWQDTNNNGVQDPDEPGIENAIVTLGDVSKATNEFGYYEFPVPYGEYKVVVQIPPGSQPSPPDAGTDDTLDSDGVPDGFGNSGSTVTYAHPEPFDSTTDFGFWTPPVEQPGTGTPGYWKNHPEAWPVDQITIGGVVYTKAQALAILDTAGKDRTLTMFSSLVPARLNVLIGNDGSCVASTIETADAWMTASGPVGSGVHPASLAWKIGEPLHRQLDNYNNGMLCAPHRD